jgi:hypothetical protein
VGVDMLKLGECSRAASHITGVRWNMATFIYPELAVIRNQITAIVGISISVIRPHSPMKIKVYQRMFFDGH